jgi:hypothetical protein
MSELTPGNIRDLRHDLEDAAYLLDAPAFDPVAFGKQRAAVVDRLHQVMLRLATMTRKSPA